jgi:hypothetical protein
MYDLPRETHCWIMEELAAGGKNFTQMIYSRFGKFLDVIKRNKRSFLRTVYDIVSGDVRTLSGSNIRKIFLDSGLDPRYSTKSQFLNMRVYQPEDTWTVPLLMSLMSK